MTHISAAVGEKIREIRKNRRYTLQDLGKIVHRSKATLSKYENGEIVLDIETLFDMARALRVSIFSLLDLPVDAETVCPRKENDHACCCKDIFSYPILYLYYYNGEHKCIRRGVIETDIENGKAKFYLDTVSLSDYRRCCQVYVGQVRSYSFYTRMVFRNEITPPDMITMVFPSMLNCQTFLIGQVFAMTVATQPICVKALVANHEMIEDREFKTMLQITPQEIKNIKRLNYFALERVAEVKG